MGLLRDLRGLLSPHLFSLVKVDPKMRRADDVPVERRVEFGAIQEADGAAGAKVQTHDGGRPAAPCCCGKLLQKMLAIVIRRAGLIAPNADGEFGKNAQHLQKLIIRIVDLC